MLIESITRMYISGDDEKHISRVLGGSILEDQGMIERIETYSQYTPFIQLNMPKIATPFGTKNIIANFLCLNFKLLAPEMIKGLRKRSSIKFRTLIQSANGPFSGISISEFEDENEIIIMPGTEQTEIT